MVVALLSTAAIRGAGRDRRALVAARTVAARRVFDAFVYARIILPEVVFAVAIVLLLQRECGFTLGHERDDHRPHGLEQRLRDA